MKKLILLIALLGITPLASALEPLDKGWTLSGALGKSDAKDQPIDFDNEAIADDCDGVLITDCRGKTDDSAWHIRLSKRLNKHF